MNPRTSPSDTRPIANLCEMSKIIERVAHKQIIKFTNANNTLDSKQLGLRSGYSGQSALLQMHHDVRHAVKSLSGRCLILAKPSIL